jgi:hypothetical protein
MSAVERGKERRKKECFCERADLWTILSCLNIVLLPDSPAPARSKHSPIINQTKQRVLKQNNAKQALSAMARYAVSLRIGNQIKPPKFCDAG